MDSYKSGLGRKGLCDSSQDVPQFDGRGLSQMKPKDVNCCVCNMPIKGLIVQALNKVWHQEHFTCFQCKRPISGQKFNVHEGKAYCEADYTQLFLKRCCGCNLPIRDMVVVALNNHWHRDHFVCTGCGCKLATKGFYERENNPFCQTCYENKFCARCKECGLPVVDTAIMALNNTWHTNCFKCSQCKAPVNDTTFEVINDKPVCTNCANNFGSKIRDMH